MDILSIVWKISDSGRPSISNGALMYLKQIFNHALNKMFGKKVDSYKKPYPNILGDAGLAYFVIHYLRRTCRSLLAELKVPSHIAELCLNHKLNDVKSIYDRYDYFEERNEAFNKLMSRIIEIIK